MLPQDPTRLETVYTVRFTTGRGRGAGIDDPGAGVFLCLIGRDGASFLHRVAPLYDAEAAEAELRGICEVRLAACSGKSLRTDTSVGVQLSRAATPHQSASASCMQRRSRAPDGSLDSKVRLRMSIRWRTRMPAQTARRRCGRRPLRPRATRHPSRASSPIPWTRWAAAHSVHPVTGDLRALDAVTAGLEVLLKALRHVHGERPDTAVNHTFLRDDRCASWGRSWGRWRGCWWARSAAPGCWRRRTFHRPAAATLTGAAHIGNRARVGTHNHVRSSSVVSLASGSRAGVQGFVERHCNARRLWCCRFVCREQLGDEKQPAGYLTPVPEGSVVYGSGSSSVILTKVRPTSVL